MEAVTERVAEVRRRIGAAGGEHRRITVVAVTKGFGPEQIDAVRNSGIEDLGENYAQELLGKAAQVDEGPRWHFLGAIQRRKVRALAPFVHLWQSVDRLVAGHEVARHAPGAAVLVQVNVTEQPGRPGCAWSETEALVDGLRQADLDVRGLMAVGSTSGSRNEFGRLASLRAALGLEELSIGMSGDLELAVEAGSTMVRVGRALFGPRPGVRDLRRYSHPRGGW
ncbi:MAG TPA: YggS family pyridoxal phosphate enzyme [Acidimicrobiales bacterium]|nr:YggS family pyridoxal phosphate enzyme [Acidimicrobiales bacterium]